MSALLLATPSEAFEQRVQRALLDAPIGRAGGLRRYWREHLLDETPQRVVDELVRTNPDVIAFGPELAVDTALELARLVDAQRPDVVVVLVAEPSIQLLERALRAGARDVIAPDAGDDDLRNALLRALDAGSRRRSSLASIDANGPPSQVIAVLSPKGGTGKTTVSSNLSLGLAHQHPGEVVIVDLDLQFGDVASALHLVPEHTFADIVHSPLSLDSTALKTFLTAHPSGVYALCAPDKPAGADVISSSASSRCSAATSVTSSSTPDRGSTNRPSRCSACARTSSASPPPTYRASATPARRWRPSTSSGTPRSAGTSSSIVPTRRSAWPSRTSRPPSASPSTWRSRAPERCRWR
jgi:pilus assembly protein CpaE